MSGAPEKSQGPLARAEPGAAPVSPFGAPLDPALLAEPVQAPARPFPLRALAALALPAAAFAGAALGQKLLEGPGAAGNLLGRWLRLAVLLGLALGALAGLALARGGARRALWIVWGALSPLLVVALVLGAVRAAHPLREALAARGAAKCRLTRKVCSVAEFRSACSEAGAGPRARERAEALLGAPAQSLCAADSCTHRWIYAGPWTPDNWVAPGSLFCSVVVDAQGAARRSIVTAGPEVP